MTLLEQLTQDYQQAMKDRLEPNKTIINYVLAQIKNKKIELQKDPEDADVVQIIKKEIKAINEAISYIEKTDKVEDLATEKQKKAILEKYLPSVMSKEQTKELIQKYITDLWITELSKQRGQLMKELMANHKSDIDWSIVNEVINEMIS